LGLIWPSLHMTPVPRPPRNMPDVAEEEEPDGYSIRILEQRRVGTIDIDKNGPGFTYDPGWVGLQGAFPISITMPLGMERIASGTFLPWAANLLPESVQLGERSDNFLRDGAG